MSGASYIARETGTIVTREVTKHSVRPCGRAAPSAKMELTRGDYWVQLPAIGWSWLFLGPKRTIASAFPEVRLFRRKNAPCSGI